MSTTQQILTSKTEALANLISGIDPTYRGGLDTVQALRMIAETAQSALTNAVEQARTEQATWAQLGDALGTSRQAAQQRYGRP